MSSSLSGGCPCGAVRFRTRGDPRDWVRCDCASCASLSRVRARGRGEPVWPNVGVEFSGGEIASSEHPCDASQRPMTLHFCAACGAPVSVSIEGPPSMRRMLASTFDDPSRLGGPSPRRGEDGRPEAR